MTTPQPEPVRAADPEPVPDPAYDAGFFERIGDSAASSAAAIVPLVLELVQPDSVIDVGCGTGAWLRAFQDRGVHDVFGVDGSRAAGGRLAIDPGSFRVVDLEAPFDPGRRYDLAICLEVVEHLASEPGAALIASLAGLAPVVLFSAAIPGQGGTGHQNEQWPSHWAELFAQQGYLPVDAIRRHVWNHPDVAFWYAQNMLIFAGLDGLARWPLLAQELARTAVGQLDLVHPRRYLEWVEWGTVGVFEKMGWAE